MILQDRAFPSTLIEMKKLLSESTRFHNEEIPPKQREKQKLFRQYRELEVTLTLFIPSNAIIVEIKRYVSLQTLLSLSFIHRVPYFGIEARRKKKESSFGPYSESMWNTVKHYRVDNCVMQYYCIIIISNRSSIFKIFQTNSCSNLWNRLVVHPVYFLWLLLMFLYVFLTLFLKPILLF